MRKSQSIAGIIVLLLGLGYVAIAWQMPQGKASLPGPGFYPFLVGLMLVLTSAAYVGLELLPRRAGGARPDEAGSQEPVPPVAPKVLQLVGLLLLFGFLLSYAGYLIASTLLVFFSVRVFGQKRLLSSIAITVIMVGVSYLLFVKWLMIQLPKGSLW